MKQIEKSTLPYSMGGNACSVELARISLNLMDFGRAKEALSIQSVNHLNDGSIILTFRHLVDQY